MEDNLCEEDYMFEHSEFIIFSKLSGINYINSRRDFTNSRKDNILFFVLTFSTNINLVEKKFQIGYNDL